MNRIYIHSGSRQRGTAIILVVACVTLLAVMGTAFIVIARLERGSTRSSTDTVNMDLAKDGAINHIRQVMMEATLDSQINAGVVSNQTLLGFGRALPWRANYLYADGDLAIGADGRVWKGLSHTSSCTVGTSGPPGNGSNGNWSPYAIDTATGTVALPISIPARNFDYPDRGTVVTNSTSTPFTVFGATNDTSGVAEPWLATDLTLAAATDLSVLTPQKFNPSTGAYDIPYSGTVANPGLPTGGDVAVVDPTVATPLLDGVWHLLPFSSASGVRYRYAMRVIDTNRFANLNTGDPTIAGLGDANGQYLSSMRLANSLIFNTADTMPDTLHSYNDTANGIYGRSPGGTFALNAWQTELLRYEYPSTGTQWFDISDELELRAYGYTGTSYKIRPASTSSPSTMFSTTLAAASVNRSNYTTYSFDRNLTTVDSGSNQANFKPRFTFTPASGFGPYTWPGDRKAVPVSGAGGPQVTDADAVIKYAAYLANAMSAAGYSDDEALSFALNYAGQTQSFAQTVTTVATNNNVSANIVCPPVITNDAVSGKPTLFARTASGGTLSATIAPIPARFLNLAGSPNLNAVMMAYRAQPFINEVAATFDATPVLTDFAVELYQPYAQAVLTGGWKLQINGTDLVVDMNQAMSGSSSLAANSYTVLHLSGGSGLTITGTPGSFDGSVTAASITANITGATNTITLLRPYFSDAAATNPSYMVVDKFVYGGMTAAAGKTYSVQRANNVPAGLDPADVNFACTAPSYSANTAAPTLGLQNTAAPTVTVAPYTGLYLPDQFPSVPAPTAATLYPVITNINDLQKIIRLSPHTVQNAPDHTLATSVVTLSDQLINTTAATANVNFTPNEVITSVPFSAMVDNTNTVPAFNTSREDAEINFDYFSDPRARQFLSEVAIVDRASDAPNGAYTGNAAYTGTVAAGTDTLQLVRIPGRINVNTASSNVLQSLPYFQTIAASGAVSAATRQSDLANVIIAYRSRGSIPITNSANSPVTISFPAATYSGTGIRHISELAVPIYTYYTTFDSATYPATPYSISLRDAEWAKLFTLCTVRSDTFVVYGYLEALRANPGYAHDNKLDWYDNVAANLTDDPNTTSTTIKNIRLAKRRFVAILDRSWCDYPRTDSSGTPVSSFVLPKVVGIRDMPR